MSIDQYLVEFDVKDSLSENQFVYSPELESKLTYNATNGFKVSSSYGADAEASGKAKELLSKLESPGERYDINKTFTITP